jgi:hypothetical protein
MPKISFPKMSRSALFQSVQTANNARNRINQEIAQNGNAKTRLRGVVPHFTKNLVGRLYSDGSLYADKRRKILAEKRKKKSAIRAAKEEAILQKELAEVTRLGRQISKRQAIKRREKKRRRKKAALSVQRTYRGYLGRRLVAAIKSERAAVVVQTLFRGSSTRKKYTSGIYRHRKDRRFLNTIFDTHMANELIDGAKFERSAFIIQRVARKKIRRLHVARELRRKSAVQIQRIWRGHQAQATIHQARIQNDRERLKTELFITQIRSNLREASIHHKTKRLKDKSKEISMEAQSGGETFRKRKNSTKKRAKHILQAAKSSRENKPQLPPLKPDEISSSILSTREYVSTSPGLKDGVVERCPKVIIDMAPKFRLGSSPGKENALALPNTPDGKKKQSGESIERQGFSGDEEYEDDFEIDEEEELASFPAKSMEIRPTSPPIMTAYGRAMYKEPDESGQIRVSPIRPPKLSERKRERAKQIRPGRTIRVAGRRS